MPTNDYHFITHWQVLGNVAEITEILGNAPDLARWWPSVYLEVKQLAPGDEQGVGKQVSLFTKGWLPYTLRWQFEVTEVHDDGFRLDATGDFVGRGIWTLVQDGPDVLVEYDWKILAEKPLLRDFSFIMKPIFGANHRWAMGKGEESLKLELARRHAKNDAERASIPNPPPATRVQVAPLVLGLLALALTIWLVSHSKRG